eukprot:5753799-Prymnesium_polylepis.1
MTQLAPDATEAWLEDFTDSVEDYSEEAAAIDSAADSGGVRAQEAAWRGQEVQAIPDRWRGGDGLGRGEDGRAEGGEERGHRRSQVAHRCRVGDRRGGGVPRDAHGPDGRARRRRDANGGSGGLSQLESKGPVAVEAVRAQPGLDLVEGGGSARGPRGGRARGQRRCPGAVSYTHLTLPTICSV